jgi:hypothetical protein
MVTLPELELGPEIPAQRAAKLFNQYGLVIARRLIAMPEIERFRRAFQVLVEAALHRYGVQPVASDDLDDAYRRLDATDAEASLALRGLGKDLVEYHRFLANEDLARALRALTGARDFQINYDQCLFRIDRPFEEEFAFDWHQDYPYNLLSVNAVTVWAPLTVITSDVGPMQAVPGSHTRLLPVTVDRSFENKSFAKHNTIRLADYERLATEFEASCIEVVDINPGDVVLMHSMLVHRSGRNRSNRCRWVVNPRFGELLDPEVVKRNWKSARAKSPFVIEEFHPEAVIPGPSRG